MLLLHELIIMLLDSLKLLVQVLLLLLAVLLQLFGLLLEPVSLLDHGSDEDHLLLFHGFCFNCFDEFLGFGLDKFGFVDFFFVGSFFLFDFFGFLDDAGFHVFEVLLEFLDSLFSLLNLGVVVFFFTLYKESNISINHIKLHLLEILNFRGQPVIACKQLLHI